MKNYKKLYQRVAAGALAAVLLPGSAYATKGTVIKSDNQKPVEIRAEDVRNNSTYNLEEAYAMAKKNNASLKSLAEKVEVMEDTKTQLHQRYEFSKPDTDIYFGSGSDISVLVNIETLTSNIGTSKYTKEMTEQGVEATVLSCFQNIKGNEQSLKLAEDALELAIQSLEDSKLKLKLGVISETELVKEEAELEKSKKNIELLKLTIDNDYVSLRRLMGLNDDRTFTIDYDVVFTPYHLEESLDQYINKVIANDPYLKIKKEAAENAKFTLNMFAVDGSGDSYKSREANYKEAERNYNEDKKNMKKALQEAANQLTQLETSREVLQADIVKAENDLKTAAVNLQVGNITQLAYDQAELGVQSAKAELETNTRKYEALKFSIDHPFMLIQGGSN